MKIALGIEYLGTHFHGWQRQAGKLRTVQAVLERTLSKVADESIQVHCAGRTDARVHGLAQVIHFETQAKRKLDAWLLGGNSFLPPDLRVLWAEHVTDDFHARFTAVARTYQYIILNRQFHSAVLHPLVTWINQPLDAKAMHLAGQFLLGEQDFSSFRASGCQSKTPYRFVEQLTVERKGEFITLTIKANAFLHHMVRNITGVLLEVGKGNKSAIWVKEVLEAKNRASASITASPNGLYLVKVDYPDGVLANNAARFPCYGS